jgi:hypothetical protein
MIYDNNGALCWLSRKTPLRALIRADVAILFMSGAGLPDFSWYKISKREKYTKLP